MSRDFSNQVYHQNYQSGASRREHILQLIHQCQVHGFGLPVNNKWQWQTKDKDIKYLLKKGKLKQKRHATPYGRNLNTGLKKGGKGQSYLVIAN